MTDEHEPNGPVRAKRRRLLVAATAGMAGVGAVFTAVPFIVSMMPSRRARSAGAPVKVDVSRLEPGQQLTVVWRGRPVWVLRRTPDMLERMRAPAHLVEIGICTHLGCVPTFRPDIAPLELGADWIGGYFCPCHRSRFDLAGRIYKGVSAPTNLEISPYRFLQETLIEVGADPERA